ncbi:hypothetical protein AX774_g5635 [Zancudomyces culisetae]|uniref:Retrotransposon gag domain-containing protein n=1 Tax=Zancudomyces culisetae TaxID=1213189 RepID=A0A1R1PJ16_ZANCU|nr:hypothetical protein AX774_g5635 [Zancudomyces culisetae]|eukprot:OMH80919.1 hypothetical protein AX774_g5635 [Zancudomyces culisetae]
MTLPKSEQKTSSSPKATRQTPIIKDNSTVEPVNTNMRLPSTILEPNRFNPESSEDAIKWLKRYQLYSVHNGWSESEKIEIMEYYLEGRARLWFECNEEKFKTWSDLKNMFSDKFAGKQQEYIAWNEIQTLKQKPGEDIDMLSYRLEKLAKAAKITDDQLKIKYLWKAMPLEKRVLLVKKEIQSYESAIKLLREEEEFDSLIGMMRDESSGTNDIADKANNHHEKTQSELGILIDKFDSFSTNIIDFITTSNNNVHQNRMRNDNYQHSSFNNRNINKRTPQRQPANNFDRNTKGTTNGNER